MRQSPETPTAGQTALFSMPSGGQLTALAVNYETIGIARGAASRAFGAAFDDVHVDAGPPHTRMVAGYLGIEGTPNHPLALTSHGRVVATITASEGALAIDRVGGEVWPRSGFAVVGSNWGTLRTALPDRVIVTGDDLLFYVVHGPASDKVEARISDLRARAALFGHPLPLEPA